MAYNDLVIPVLQDAEIILEKGHLNKIPISIKIKGKRFFLGNIRRPAVRQVIDALAKANHEPATAIIENYRLTFSLGIDGNTLLTIKHEAEEDQTLILPAEAVSQLRQQVKRIL